MSLSAPPGGIRFRHTTGKYRYREQASFGKRADSYAARRDPTALKGEPRFELTFTLDREKQLRVTARDLVTGILVKKDAPVHRLT